MNPFHDRESWECWDDEGCTPLLNRAPTRLLHPCRRWASSKVDSLSDDEPPQHLGVLVSTDNRNLLLTAQSCPKRMKCKENQEPPKRLRSLLATGR